MIRHGESDGNANGLCQGFTSGSLTPKGIQQATALGSTIKSLLETVDDIYCSDLNRVVQTCQISLSNSSKNFNDVKINELLREKNAGIYEMKPKSLLINERDNFQGDKRTHKPKDGESFNDLQARVVAFITLLNKQQYSDQSKILIYTSGGFIMEYINHYILNENIYPNKASNCSIYIFKMINNKMEMIVENRKTL